MNWGYQDGLGKNIVYIKLMNCVDFYCLFIVKKLEERKFHRLFDVQFFGPKLCRYF